MSTHDFAFGDPDHRPDPLFGQLDRFNDAELTERIRDLEPKARELNRALTDLFGPRRDGEPWAYLGQGDDDQWRVYVTPLEIAEHLRLPEEFLAHEHTRGFYGDLVHNVKAVYQRYLSWYDANPANLNRLSPTEAGRRYVDAFGGADRLLDVAQAAFDAGDYRWAAELGNHAVFADPSNQRARDLQADTLEQLGYQSESATFRNAYLTGAQELRQGKPKLTRGVARARVMIRAMRIEQVFDTLAVRVLSEQVGGLSATINWTFDDLADTPDHRWVLGLSNRTLYAVRGRHEAAADVTVRTTRRRFLEVIAQTTTFMDEMAAGNVTVEGDAQALLTVFANLDVFESGFAIVEP